MARNQLHVYHGPPAEPRSTTAQGARKVQEKVTVPVGEIVPWLVDAALRKRTWLKDFEDEEITISRDLYEVTMAYRRYQRSPA